MKFRRIYSLLTAAVLMIGCFTFAGSVSVKAADKIIVWNNAGGETPIAGARLNNCTTYIPVRAFLESVDKGCSISWDDSTKTVSAELKGLTLTIQENKTYIIANGRYLYTTEVNFIEDGVMLVALRPLARACGLSVTWNQKTKTPALEGSYSAIESGESFYDADSVYWLSRIINSEAGIEGLDGKIAVGNVVLNRVKHKSWPDTIYGVIFDDRVCVQFTPTATGTIYNDPSRDSVIAAKLVLDGADTAGESVYFVNEAIAKTSWFSRNCTYIKTIGRHTFYGI